MVISFDNIAAARAVDREFNYKLGSNSGGGRRGGCAHQHPPAFQGAPPPRPRKRRSAPLAGAVGLFSLDRATVRGSCAARGTNSYVDLSDRSGDASRTTPPATAPAVINAYSDGRRRRRREVREVGAIRGQEGWRGMLIGHEPEMPKAWYQRPTRYSTPGSRAPARQRPGGNIQKLF